MEYCAQGTNSFDSNAAQHFQVMSNELSTPRILVCPKDRSRKPATAFANLQTNNVSYRLHSGTNLTESNPIAVLAVCPLDGNTLLCDGTVTARKPDWKSPMRAMMDVVSSKYLEWLALLLPVFMVSGLVLLWAGSRLKWKAKGGPKPIGLTIGEALLLIVAVLLIYLMMFPTAHH
jgi:hypothetical protein